MMRKTNFTLCEMLIHLIGRLQWLHIFRQTNSKNRIYIRFYKKRASDFVKDEKKREWNANDSMIQFKRAHIHTHVVAYCEFTTFKKGLNTKQNNNNKKCFLFRAFKSNCPVWFQDFTCDSGTNVVASCWYVKWFFLLHGFFLFFFPFWKRRRKGEFAQQFRHHAVWKPQLILYEL